MIKNIAAFTPAAPQPAYVSVNKHLDTDLVSITVRSPPKPNGDFGDTASIDLEPGDYQALLEAMKARS